MARQLNTDKLARAIRLKRGSFGLRQTADEIGISHTTLTRLEQGYVPDVDTYIRICKWLQVPTESFINNPQALADEPKKKVVALLRSDKTLPPKVAEALVQMITLAYSQKEKKNSKTKE